MLTTALRSLDALAAHLPFSLHDMKQVNAHFLRWHRGEREVERVVDLWTYCYIRRYFLVKFTQETSYAASDLDVLVELVFKKVERGRSSVRHPDRYASWVSVICKHTFLNYLRARRRVVSIVEEHLPATEEEDFPASFDVGLLLQALLAAIARLPDFLQEVAHLRFVEDRSYEEIQERTGLAIPSLRAYVNKVLARFRGDPCLMAFLDEYRGLSDGAD